MNLIIDTSHAPILELQRDSDSAGDIQSRKSASRNFFLLGKNTIQWFTKKQSCIELSSAEAEYVSAANITRTTMDL